MTAAMLDGFNLLPHRARRRREIRRRRLALLGALGLAGCAAVGAVAGWDMFERARLDDRRVALEASLRASGAQLEEHARLVRAETDRRHAREAARPRALPRDHFLALLEALADTPPQRGVTLQRVTQRSGNVELAALAPDSHAAAQWLKRLERLNGVEAVEVTEMKRHTDAALLGKRNASASIVERPGHYEFIALVRYGPQGEYADAASRRVRPVLASNQTMTQGRRP